MEAKLCLGTAQWGMKYGITNKKGKLCEIELDDLISNAIAKNINYFDTASAYGDSEKIIGEKLNNKNAKLITKFQTRAENCFTEELIAKLEINFQRSLKRLNRKKLDSYLLHNPNDYKKENNNLLSKWLNSLKERGLIERYGISIYQETDLLGIPLKELDVIQMPISIYDQRLIKDSIIDKLLENNISIHIRSIFLQGLLLQDSKNWPINVDKYFLNHHISYENELKNKNLTLLEGAISFIKKLDFAELVLFGVTNISELNAFYETWNCKKVLGNKLNFSLFQWHNAKDIDPRRWE